MAPEPQAPTRTIEVRFVVEPNYHGWRLDRYLCEKIRRLTRNQAQRIIERDLSDRRLKPSSPVRRGQTLVLRRPVKDEPPAPPGLPRIYEDDDLLVVDKPAGLTMHPTARVLEQTLVARVRALWPGARPDPAHRLDRETSGVVVCGKRPEVTGRLKAAFARGEVRKTYLAVVHGHPADAFEVDLPLAVGGVVVRVRAVVDRRAGKPSRTRMWTVERRASATGEPFALVRAEPLTGRQHQIRAHLSAVGHPVVGDKIYGPDESIFLRLAEGRLTDDDRRRLVLSRQALHAAHVALEHPADRRPVEFTAPLAEDLTAFLSALAPVVDRPSGH